MHLPENDSSLSSNMAAILEIATSPLVNTVNITSYLPYLYPTLSLVLSLSYTTLSVSVAQSNARPTGDQEVTDSIPERSGNILSGDFIGDNPHSHSREAVLARACTQKGTLYDVIVPLGYGIFSTHVTLPITRNLFVILFFFFLLLPLFQL